MTDRTEYNRRWHRSAYQNPEYRKKKQEASRARYAEHPDKVKQSNRAWRKANPERKRQISRKSHLLNMGLTLEGYNAILVAQGGGCSICGTPPGERNLHIDHDHSCCPKDHACMHCLRGLLCNDCNLMLGFAKDNPSRLRGGIQYLERHVL